MSSGRVCPWRAKQKRGSSVDPALGAQLLHEQARGHPGRLPGGRFGRREGHAGGFPGPRDKVGIAGKKHTGFWVPPSGWDDGPVTLSDIMV